MTTAGHADDGRHDFEFIYGDWTIRNHRLRNVLDPGCTDWVDFDTTSHTEPILDGLAHLEQIHCGPNAPGGPWEGLTLRQFDPRTRLWQIWWASSKNPGQLEPPLIGRFTDGLGTFTGDDELDGRPMRVRYEWTNPAPGLGRWSQAFSFDNEHTWQANWIMEFTATTRRAWPVSVH